MAAPALTRASRSVVVVVSLTSVVRVFSRGQIVAEIIPDFWMLGQESIQIEGPYMERKITGLRIFSSEIAKDAKESDQNTPKQPDNYQGRKPPVFSKISGKTRLFLLLTT